MTKLIDGHLIATKVKDDVCQNIYNLTKNLDQRPGLAIILVGENKESQLYVSIKEKEAKRVGIDTHLYHLDHDIDETKLIEVINFLNQDAVIDGILVQLPLPSQFNTNKITQAIKPEKDVDGFHPQHPNFIISPVIAAVQASIEATDLSNKQKSDFNKKLKASIFTNSDVFTKELQGFLIKNQYEILDSENSSQADLIISAVGKPKSIKAKDIKKGAVLIDIGITKKENKVFGDIDFDSVKNKASYLTPVPGGIGPMTIAFLFKNVWEIYKRKLK